MAIIESKRPARPSSHLSKTRGLNDGVWDLIEACWSQDPSQRPTAAEVVKQLQVLPNQPVDHRPTDDFRTNFPPQALYKYKYVENPFSVLTTTRL